MILITGAAGFIGSAVAHALNKRGESRLILADRFGTAEKWKNLRGLKFINLWIAGICLML
jgi:ADP-L-glycero-D-manno-heptose 6-epimerase